LSAKNLDWPEAIWDAWISFEYLHGSVNSVDACFDKIEKAQYQVNARRAKVDITFPERRHKLMEFQEAEKASQQTIVATEQVAAIPVVDADVEMVSVAVEVDRRNEASNSQTKRKAEDADSIGEHKKARTGEDDCLFFGRVYLTQIL
jgi:squamous cell carcinoma antigen recognized by T-cells 3